MSAHKDEIARVMREHGVSYAEAVAALSGRPAAEILQSPAHQPRGEEFRSAQEAATDAVMDAHPPGKITRTEAAVIASGMNAEEIERITHGPTPTRQRGRTATMRDAAPSPAAVPALRIGTPHVTFADRPAHATTVPTNHPRSILDTPVPFAQTREGRALAEGRPLMPIKAVGGHT